jgi:hypothetical protein
MLTAARNQEKGNKSVGLALYDPIVTAIMMA